VTHDGVDSIAIKPMAFVGLTFDHRILDGNSADDFMTTIKQALESWS
jgi:2-oxoglutarate dehydrogenase E2 component (dihydrolipoamide succinyltransferase)